MNISNFGDDNYLTGNDLWVTLKDFASVPKNLKLKVKNLVNAKQHDLVLYPLPNNQFTFNITSAVRSLFDAPIHNILPLNTFAKFEIKLEITFSDATPSEIEIIEKYFIRGYRQDKGSDLNYINLDTNLLIGNAKFYTKGIKKFDDYFSLQKLNGVSLIFKNLSSDLITITECNYKIIKFLNSIGGYQYFLFENFEIKNNTKPLKNVPKIINAFNDTAFRSLGTELKKEIELITENPAEDQIIITEIINSIDVLMWEPTAEIWIKLVPNTNTTIDNTWDKTFKNKIKFDFYNEVNNVL